MTPLETLQISFHQPFLSDPWNACSKTLAGTSCKQACIKSSGSPSQKTRGWFLAENHQLRLKRLKMLKQTKHHPNLEVSEGLRDFVDHHLRFWTPSICWKFIDRMHQKARLLTRPRQVNSGTLRQEKKTQEKTAKQILFSPIFSAFFLLNWKRLLKTISKLYKLGRRKSQRKKQDPPPLLPTIWTRKN